MKLSIFGSGYVGLVTSICFASVGNHVVCVDIDAKRIARLKAGECPIFEPGLQDLLQENLAEKRLHFTTEATEVIKQSDIIFIAVGTPSNHDGSADLTDVLQVAKTIGQALNGYKVIVNKSTVPVGTADQVQHTIDNILKDRGETIAFEVVSNPEFLKEGNAVADCMKPDRIILGVNSERATRLMRALYAPFNRHHEKIQVMDVRSAELTKYAANAMLATKITFMNELSQIAERLGADIELVRKGIGSDPRIGYAFIYPGCGYGGSCFPKDVQALTHIATTHHYTTQLLQAVHYVNERQKYVLFEKVMAFYQNQIKGKIFAIWGLAFKPNTDDIRAAPSRTVIEALWKAGAKIQAYDPQANDNFDRIYRAQHHQQYSLHDNAEACLQAADALIIFTEWMPFRSPDFQLLASLLKDKVIFDGRNLYLPDIVKQYGLSYRAIGRV